MNQLKDMMSLVEIIDVFVVSIFVPMASLYVFGYISDLTFFAVGAIVCWYLIFTRMFEIKPSSQ